MTVSPGRASPVAGPVLALDLGGMQIRVAAALPGGALVGARRSRTPVQDGGEAIVAACITALRDARVLFEERMGATARGASIEASA